MRVWSLKTHACSTCLPCVFIPQHVTRYFHLVVRMYTVDALVHIVDFASVERNPIQSSNVTLSITGIVPVNLHVSLSPWLTKSSRKGCLIEDAVRFQEAFYETKVLRLLLHFTSRRNRPIFFSKSRHKKRSIVVRFWAVAGGCDISIQI